MVGTWTIRSIPDADRVVREIYRVMTSGESLRGAWAEVSVHEPMLTSAYEDIEPRTNLPGAAVVRRYRSVLELCMTGSRTYLQGAFRVESRTRNG
jgi:hypothetical protein